MSILTLCLSLTQTKGDAILEAEVTRVFSDYGTVFVKIRRDQKNMPFAFCQYTVRTFISPAVVRVSLINRITASVMRTPKLLLHTAMAP